MAKRKRKLIEKYEIPINHLDFGYIKKCNNAREIEKILQILYSGEEGYYEELTKCAEEKLKILKPNSKLFRLELDILKKQALDKEEWEKDGEPVVEWSDEVKVKDNFLSVIANEKNLPICVPDVRGKNKKIGFTKEENKKIRNENKSSNNIDNSKRIKSTDYRAWDKYDADTECLKMELDEERTKEENEINKLKEQKENAKEIIIPMNESKEILDKLTNVEKETFSLKHKDRGNDYFRIKEYKNALVEYTKCIEIYPTAAAYNNRAITYMKLHLYAKALDDIDKCLKMEPMNIKALLRKAQSFIAMDKKNDAYRVYTKIISIEPSNVAARNGINDIRKILPESSTPKATRITIKEEEEDNENEHSQIKTNDDGKSLKIENQQNKIENVTTENDSKKNISEFIKALTNNETNFNTNISEAKTIETNQNDENLVKKPQENLKTPMKKSQIFQNVEILKSKYQATPNISKISQSHEVVKEQNTKNSRKENEEPKQGNQKKSDSSDFVENNATKNNKNNTKETLNISKNAICSNQNKKQQQKKSKPINCDDDNYMQEDLSKLIIPKKIVKSKLAKTMEVFKNNNIPLPTTSKMKQTFNDTGNNQKSLMPSRKSAPEAKMNIKLFPDKPKIDTLIKEIK